ncbi:MAG: MarR family transcriptional regulator [Pseudomonadota bacterium]
MSAPDLVHRLDRIMRRIDAEMHRRGPAIDTDRVGPLGSVILTRLQRMAPTPVQKLAESMGRDPSQMTRSLKDLEAKGLIVRADLPNDKRVCLLDLTEKGQAHVHKLDAVMTGVVEEILEPLSVCEKELLERLISRL